MFPGPHVYTAQLRTAVCKPLSCSLRKRAGALWQLAEAGTGAARQETPAHLGSPLADFPRLYVYQVRTRVYQSTHVPHEVPTPPSLCLVEGWLPSEQVGTHPLPMLNHTRKKPGPLFLVCSELAHRQSTAEKDH